MFAETFKNMKTLLKEIRAQFSLNEWLSAMKQGAKELLPAFFCYIPTAHAKSVKGGAILTQPGEQLTFNERFNYLKNGSN